MQTDLTAAETKQAKAKSKTAIAKKTVAEKTATTKRTRTPARSTEAPARGLRVSKAVEDPHAIYLMEPTARIRLIKRGVRAAAVSSLAKRMEWTKERFTQSLGLSIATIDRRVRDQENLTTQESERYIGLIKLIGQVQVVVEQSGDPGNFDATQWFAQWLDKPLPALGGSRPVEYIDTSEGREMLSRLIAMAQSGAYA